MIQRFLYQILDVGIEAVKADLTLLDEVLRPYELSAAELAQVRELWRAKPPHVKHHYARSDDDFPLYAIVLGTEGEADLYIGDDAGVVLDEEDELYNADVSGSIWEHTYQVLVYTEHPEHTLYNYEVAKSLLRAAKLSAFDLFQYRLTGADLAPDARFVPAHLFVRTVTLTCRSEYTQVDALSRFRKALSVRGIHIDKSGSPSDVGGVETQVTPYSEGDDG